jgi:hypothetical protein
MALPPDTQKIFDYLKKLLADGKELNLSIDEIKKKAKTPNILNATVSALIKREQKKGNFKNLSIKKFAKGAEVGKSKYDADYKNNKKFRDFYNENYKTPWDDIDQKTNLKDNAYRAFLRNQKLKKAAKGFTLTGEEMAKKLGLPLQTLRTYESKPDKDSSTRFIRDNIEKKRTVGVNPTIGRRETVVRYKDPGVNVLKNWNALISSPKISSAMVDNIKEYDKLFRKKLKDNKGKLPDIGEVIQKTSMSTPTTIANTEALYSRLLRGETFRTDIDLAKDAVLGKKIINELAIDSSNNARRSAFYYLALDNVDKLYPQKSGTLRDFKINFRNELKKILGPGIKEVPFSVNEVIGLSTGESRAIQPFSVFVDAVETNINKNELKNYQGAFSTKVKKIQDLLSGNKPNKAEAEKIALSLDSNRNTLVNRLTKKGFTISQINELNIPDIKIGETIDPKIYSPKTLERFKKAGLDIGQFAKDKGFYVDVKKAKPFWESNIRNTIVAAAQNNTGNVCSIFSGKIAFSKDGGRIGFSGGCGKEMAAAMETDAAGTLNQVSRTKGILPKFQNVAKNFLQSPILKGAGKYGAIAAGGAVAAGFVKKFMNDDPSTYLSNEDQQKNMLVDMVTGSLDDTPEERPAILDYQLPVLGGAAVAGTAVTAPSTIEAARSARFGKTPSGITKTALKTLGRGLGALGTPAGLLATEPLFLAGQVQQGDSLGEIATNPMNYLGAAFVGPIDKFATKGLSPQIAKTMRLGISPNVLKTVSRRFGLPGLALSLGISGYETFDDYRNKRGMFSEE